MWKQDQSSKTRTDISSKHPPRILLEFGDALLGALPFPLDFLLGRAHALLQLAHARFPLALGDSILGPLFRQPRLGFAELFLRRGEAPFEGDDFRFGGAEAGLRGRFGPGGADWTGHVRVGRSVRIRRMA